MSPARTQTPRGIISLTQGWWWWMETLIGSVFTGLAALLIAVFGAYAQVGRKRSFDRKAARQEQARLEAQFLAARRWGIRCEQKLLDHQIKTPPRPAELDLDWGVEDDESEPPTRRITA